MDEVPSPRELRAAARAATIIAYATGLAGVAGGTLLLRQDELGLAVLVWMVTFAVGGCLIGVATLVRAAAGTSARLDRLDGQVAALRRDLVDGGAHGSDWRHGSPR